MKRQTNVFIAFFTVAILITMLIVPASAAETRVATYCSIHNVPLEVIPYTVQHDVWKVCENTLETGYVHAHYLLYNYKDYVCPTCGRKDTELVSVREICSLGNAARKPSAETSIPSSGIYEARTWR